MLGARASLSRPSARRISSRATSLATFFANARRTPSSRETRARAGPGGEGLAGAAPKNRNASSALGMLHRARNDRRLFFLRRPPGEAIQQRVQRGNEKQGEQGGDT